MNFFVPLIGSLIQDGYKVDIATNEGNGEVSVPSIYREWGCNIFPLSCTRSMCSLRDNIRAIREIKEITEKGKYDIVHCHTPIAATCTRLACRKIRKNGVRVIYTAHGFHFYTGAPIKNWLLYYPIEWLCSYWTDSLITINTEDYKRAKEHLHAGQTKYIPGIGVDTLKFNSCHDGSKIRDELQIGKNEFVLLSVGELNTNKNHSSVIKAISGLTLTYIITGEGEKREELVELATKCRSHVLFTGFRTDVADFYSAADAYILPSLREGLNVSLMEAMASGLVCTASRIRGNTDLMDHNGGFLIDPKDIGGIKKTVEKMMLSDRKKMGDYNKKKIQSFSTDVINKQMRDIYANILNN